MIITIKIMMVVVLIVN